MIDEKTGCKKSRETVPLNRNTLEIGNPHLYCRKSCGSVELIGMQIYFLQMKLMGEVTQFLKENQKYNKNFPSLIQLLEEVVIHKSMEFNNLM